MLERIPPWVFAIFVVLVVIGLLLRRTRAVAPTAVAVVAVAMLALSLFGVVGSFGATPGPLLSWAVGIALAASIGGQVFGPHGLQVVPDSAKVLVPGSWVPLVLMMGIFLGKFIVGFAVGVGAPMVKQAWFGLAAALAFGVFSGGFVARAIAVRRTLTQLGHACRSIGLVLAAPGEVKAGRYCALDGDRSGQSTGHCHPSSGAWQVCRRRPCLRNHRAPCVDLDNCQTHGLGLRP